MAVSESRSHHPSGGALGLGGLRPLAAVLQRRVRVDADSLRIRDTDSDACECICVERSPWILEACGSVCSGSAYALTACSSSIRVVYASPPKSAAEQHARDWRARATAQLDQRTSISGRVSPANCVFDAAKFAGNQSEPRAESLEGCSFFHRHGGRPAAGRPAGPAREEHDSGIFGSIVGIFGHFWFDDATSTLGRGEDTRARTRGRDATEGGGGGWLHVLSDRPLCVS